MEFHPFLLMFQCAWVFLFMFQCQGSLGYVDEERRALLEIKASVWYNDLLSTWVENRTSNYCAWRYVQCSETTGCVSRLNLADVFSTGRSNSHPLLNASLFLSFKDLKHLDISDNGFVSWEYNQGIEKLSNLKKLQILSIGGNHFNSNVLEPLSELTSLKILNLSHNDIGAGSFSEIPKAELFGALRGRLHDSNKNLIMATLATIGAVTSAMGPTVEKASKGILSNILKCLSDNKKQMRECTVNTLDSWVAAVHLDKMVPYIIASLSDTKIGAEGRKDLFDWLSKQISALVSNGKEII